MKSFETKGRWWLHNIVNTLNAARLFTFKGYCMLCEFHLNGEKNRKKSTKSPTYSKDSRTWVGLCSCSRKTWQRSALSPVFKEEVKVEPGRRQHAPRAPDKDRGPTGSRSVRNLCPNISSPQISSGTSVVIEDKANRLNRIASDNSTNGNNNNKKGEIAPWGRGESGF